MDGYAFAALAAATIGKFDFIQNRTFRPRVEVMMEAVTAPLKAQMDAAVSRFPIDPIGLKMPAIMESTTAKTARTIPQPAPAAKGA
jgi:hypothetical protein